MLEFSGHLWTLVFFRSNLRNRSNCQLSQHSLRVCVLFSLNPLHVPPLQSCPPWACMPAAGQISSGLPPGWNLLWSSGKGPWYCCSGYTQSSAPSQLSIRTDGPETNSEAEWLFVVIQAAKGKGAAISGSSVWWTGWHNSSTLLSLWVGCGSVSVRLKCWLTVWVIRCHITWPVNS